MRQKGTIQVILIYALAGVIIAGVVSAIFILPKGEIKDEPLAQVSQSFVENTEEGKSEVSSEETQIEQKQNLLEEMGQKEVFQPETELKQDKARIQTETKQNEIMVEIEAKQDEAEGLRVEDTSFQINEPLPLPPQTQTNEPTSLTQEEIRNLEKDLSLPSFSSSSSSPSEAEKYYSQINTSLSCICPCDSGVPLQRGTFSNKIKFLIDMNCKHYKGDYNAYSWWGEGLLVGFENFYWIPLNWLLFKNYIPPSIEDIARMDKIYSCEFGIYLNDNGFLNWSDLNHRPNCEAFLQMTPAEQFIFNCDMFKNSGQLYFGSTYEGYNEYNEIFYGTDMCDEVYYLP